MKKIFTFIVLLCHMNFTMFFPTVEEHDVYEANGVMVDEINSVYEYIDEVLLDNKDDSPEDEDDDEPDYYQMVKAGDLYYHQEMSVTPNFSATTSKISYSSYYQVTPLTLSYDIVAPPPEA